uniref:G-protein coupled receptors family 1 profile domain-containing protein n=1 Tax=Plectus sambesii TaxID=2011161 RepID=A0A914X896_9BILA
MSGDNETDYSCAKWGALFSNFNHYFRDEAVINNTEHASVAMGIGIFCLYIFVIAFGACGNLLTFSAVIRNPAMRTNRNLFIFNLAMSDFVLCTVTAPTTLYTIMYFFWPFGTVMCKLAGSLQGINIFVSSFSISSIGLDRYVVIIFPTKRDRQRHFMLFCFVFIWLISFGLAVPLLIASDLKPIHHDPLCNLYFDICHEQNFIWGDMIVSKEVYTISVMAIQYCLPLASLVFVDEWRREVVPLQTQLHQWALHHC